jgi:hypothetical protein
MGQVVMLVKGAAVGSWTDGPVNRQFVMIAYPDLTLTAFKTHLPDSVVLPLIGDGFDALDALARLAQFGFKGRVTVTGPALPNPAAIKAELSAAVPGMTVSLVCVQHQAGLSRL